MKTNLSSKLNYPLLAFGNRAAMIAVVAIIALLASSLAASSPAYAVAPVMELSKSSSAGTVQPGEQLEYRIELTCSGLQEGCVDATITDTLPAEFDVASIPNSSSERDVTYDANTRVLTVKFLLPITNPASTSGLPAGATRSVSVGMRLPVATAVTNGQVIPNKAVATATNALPVDSSVNVVAQVPVEVRPRATKNWSPSGSIAQSGDSSSLTLGVRNASSTSADVRSLRITDDTEETFNAFDVTQIGPIATYPAGADRVIVGVCTKAIGTPCTNDWTESGQLSGSGPFTPPGGVALADITGLQFTFLSVSGDPLPFSADQGQIDVGLELRDTYRSNGAPVQPQTRLVITNEVTPEAIVDGGGSTTGPKADANYAIDPDTIVVQATKNMYADNSGNWKTNGNIVVGENSGLTMTLKATNQSSGPVKTLVIDEPSPSAVQEFDKIDLTKARFTWPAGSTTATLAVVCRSGASPAPVVFQKATSPATVYVNDLGCEPGAFPGSVRMTYLGEDGSGNGTIESGADGQLDLHGTAPRVDQQDVSDGLKNCFEASATTPQSSSAASIACKTANVSNPTPGFGTTVKSAGGVTTIVPGQVMRYNMRVRNGGNVPLNGVFFVDPVDPSASPVPFDIVRLDRITSSSTPANTKEVWDPQAGGGSGAYVAYNRSDTALMERATGIRVIATEPLPVNGTFRVNIDVLVRDGVPADGSVKFPNCAQAGYDGSLIGSPVCAPEVTVEGADAGASLSKEILPSSILRPEVGLPPQVATVKHRINNSGNMYLKNLVFTDKDHDFFDGVTFSNNIHVNMPPGANRVQVDACTTQCKTDVWTDGTRTNNTNPGLPSGVNAADVQGIRVTFTKSNNGYSLLPGKNFPASGSCKSSSVCFDVTAREFLRSNPTTPIPAQLVDSSDGSFEWTNGVVPLSPVTSTLDVVNGTAKMRFAKGPDSRIGPGDQAPFDLTLENTGTTAIVDPVITDPFPDDLTLEENAPGGSPGRPFVVSYPALPSGYAPLPSADVDYVETKDGVDANRITKATWTFTGWNLPPGGKLNIRIYVKLTPGTPASETITNTAGSHGSNSTITCASGNTSVTDDPTYGDGLYCLDPATIESLSGNAVEAQKWSAGNPALGFYNTVTNQAVKIGDPSCSQYIDNGRTYTRFPCAAAVNPGETIYNLIRLVNAGTNDMTSAVAVDGLPVQRDTGVLLTGSARGTDWSTRPTMLTPVTMSETYTGVSTGYTNSAYAGAAGTPQICNADLTGGTCLPTAFNDSFSDAAIGFRTEMNFGTPLTPGQGVTLTWTMKSPLMLDTTATLPAAWNSFAQRGTFTGGIQTAASEPLEVGTVMRFGAIKVSKQVFGVLPGTTLPPFSMGYRCTISGQEISSGTIDVVDGNTAELPLQPTGAECSVWEIETNGASSPNAGEGNAVVITVPDPTTDPAGVTVPIENSFQAGQLTVRKEVTGDAAGLALAGGGTLGTGPYEFNVSCEFPSGGAELPGFPVTFSLNDGDKMVLNANTGSLIPAGSVCTVDETGSNNATVTVVTADGSTPVSEDFIIVDVLPDFVGGSIVDFENQFDAGTIRIDKQLTGAGAGFAQGPFEFSVDCTLGSQRLASIPATVVVAGLTTTVAPLPVGASCIVTETDAADSTTVVPVVVDTVTVPAADADPVVVTAANDYPAGYVSVSKVVDGAGADLVGDATFTVRVVCERTRTDLSTEIVLDELVGLTGGETKNLPDPLPIPSSCYAQETADGGATSVVIDHGPSLPIDIDTPDQVAEITITNTFDSGEVVVGKTIKGPAPEDANYAFSLACTMPAQSGSAEPTYPIALPSEDSSFTLQANQSRTVGVPQGARCQVVETNSQGATNVTYTDSTGGTDGSAVANPNGWVSVKNEFAKPACVIKVNAKSGKRVKRNGVTVLVKKAKTSKDCKIKASKSELVCKVKRTGKRGDLKYCDFRISSRGRVVVETFGYKRVRVTPTLVAKPKPRAKADRSKGAWSKTWRVR
jgi:uncharacterized repeat protein (TIGR01451 family)